jgi:hypothetical protein
VRSVSETRLIAGAFIAKLAFIEGGAGNRSSWPEAGGTQGAAGG